jgi:hypothetical protein
VSQKATVGMFTNEDSRRGWKSQSRVSMEDMRKPTIFLQEMYCGSRHVRNEPSPCTPFFGTILLPGTSSASHLGISARIGDDEEAGLLEGLLDLVSEGTRSVAAGHVVGTSVLAELEHSALAVGACRDHAHCTHQEEDINTQKK